jgi:hypothetical protein
MEIPRNFSKNGNLKILEKFPFLHVVSFLHLKYTEGGKKPTQSARSQNPPLAQIPKPLFHRGFEAHALDSHCLLPGPVNQFGNADFSDTAAGSLRFAHAQRLWAELCKTQEKSPRKARHCDHQGTKQLMSV